MERVDAHCHFWDPGRGHYHWLKTGPAALDPLRRVCAPGDLARLNATSPVVVVQAADVLDETRYLLGLAAANPQILGVVGWVDLADPASADTLHSFAAHPKFKGIRPMLQDLAQDDWIATRPAPASVQALQDLGLRFDALVLRRHLGPLLGFAQAWPDLPIVIDHCAKPMLADSGPVEPEWRDGLAALAARETVHCKLSGLLTELPATLRSPDLAFQALKPVVDLVIDLFGPSRLMWGSDWPVLTLAADHAAWGALTDRLLDDLNEAERTAILGNTARRFYGLEGSDG